ncbi:hypothetical protein, partial [Priestia megaterium]
MSYLLLLIIASIILGLQRYLSTRKNVYLGGVLPFLFASFICLNIKRLLDSGQKFYTLLAILACLTGLINMWISGRG